jgi:Domain of unknown function (DUF4134)
VNMGEAFFELSTLNIYRMNCVKKQNRIQRLQRAVLLFLSLIAAIIAEAQDGNAGINEANTKVRSYFAAGTNLMYAVGAIVGLIGAVKVYQKWNSGDHDTGKVAAAWFGSCVFLVIVATVIRSFFGV